MSKLETKPKFRHKEKGGEYAIFDYGVRGTGDMKGKKYVVYHDWWDQSNVFVRELNDWEEKMEEVLTDG